MNPNLHKIRVNVKSLAAEARIIRQEMRRAKTREAKECLAEHRINHVRKEARMANLTLAFIKGLPYRTVEGKTRSLVLQTELWQKARRFCHCTVDQIGDWLGSKSTNEKAA